MRLVLQLGPDWRLSADRHCYALESRVMPRSVQARAERADRWKASGYYTTPHGAFRALWRAQAWLISAESVEELAQAYRAAGERICAELRSLSG